MEWLILAKALLLGIVEGLTEFLPVSSTGHLIVVGDLIGFNNNTGKVFEVVIQLGAILAVVWEYRARFSHVACGMLAREPASIKFVSNLIVAFLPSAVIGFLAVGAIKYYLFNPVCVALALVVGGFIILWAERRQIDIPPRVHDVDAMDWKDALKVGVAQVFAMVPGTSRSGATIIGGMLFGLDRKVATEFSFFLAVPTMFAATIYDVFKHRDLFTAADIPVFAVGMVSSFISAFIVVRWLIRFVSGHTFNVFAWYRIAFGLIILASWYWGWVAWTV
ncbi:undecaprenyl-diphosphate phosphatase [Aquitalea sp. S1-19]|uniref:Undecaprenyl-diphosphatase n=1 Tax=Craterilacuibacter sinensis TaxID=2686017 RepID=A0A845BMX8_9NEIS|nr:undecaprenyl-diphosphate phosphatase [Craterilacuibacter sinensis]MCP9758921.1 undecaprenyl-diphosphate phosphatase [Aquitalea sp. S1-19]MXR37619.1 undecaprenyl-diphosphate phosphatase [Craterilacuibacter sinensis]RQW28119.1 undecaprenyl-diphosphate phosphatase [Rhodobacteraceae bacterium CH30]